LSAIKRMDHKGSYFWSNEDQYLHREDGPAITYIDGTKKWYLNGQLHREDGPACQWADGYEEWYHHGALIRPSVKQLVQWEWTKELETYLNHVEKIK